MPPACDFPRLKEAGLRGSFDCRAGKNSVLTSAKRNIVPHRVETSRNQGVHNEQGTGVFAHGPLLYLLDLNQEHPSAVCRTKPSTFYNCHGLTFASRRTQITQSAAVEKILDHDKYREVAEADALPGDVVVYSDNQGEANHSGVVVASVGVQILPSILSKWGNGAEYVHAVNDVPNEYGPNRKYYRCRL